MPDDKRKTVCTVDHANKQSDAAGFNSCDFWLKRAEQLRAARQRADPARFRRDQTIYGAS